jgi:peptide/nickel transport system permease protein
MKRFLLRRLALAFVTLIIMSVLVFALTQVLPGDLGRNVLGNLASPEDVAAFNHEHGLDKPVIEQYLNWVSNILHGDLGESVQYQVSVKSLLIPSLKNSLKLAALAFALVVPLSLIGVTIAALRRGRATDRAITLAGLSLTAVPEFVTGIVLIVVFGITLEWLPVSATPPDDYAFRTMIKHLLLPALALVCVLFGYIARIVRAGVIESLDADYTRTARLKGVRPTTVLTRHVLRNALLPTIAVVATQTGYLIGGLVVIETLFAYDGIGKRIYDAAYNQDVVVLQSGVLIIGTIYLLTTLVADLLYSLLNPRIRYGGD